MTNEDMPHVLAGWGRRLSEARRAAGYTQHELALRISTHDNTVARWEIGSRRPSEEDQALIAGILGQPVSSLFPRDAAEAAQCALIFHEANPTSLAKSGDRAEGRTA